MSQVQLRINDWRPAVGSRSLSKGYNCTVNFALHAINVVIKSIPSGNIVFECDARRNTCIAPAAKTASRALGPSPAMFARPAKEDKVIKMQWNAR